jgi:flavin reductase (DIM6/NTAB) family NADH-FMN oxidoreductase RutF
VPIDPTLFRDLMASFPAGVTVTALGDDGDVRGLTVSSFCSVSLDPPLVLVCIDKGSNTLPAIQARSAFTVNFLATGREELAGRLAGKGSTKFEGVRAGRHQGGRR